MDSRAAIDSSRLVMGRRRAAALVAIAIAAVALLAALAPGRAGADSPIYQFEVHPSTTQAGGHPNIDTLIWVGNRYTQHIPPPSCDCQDPRDILIEMPPGVIGDPHATPKCSVADFSTEHCPPETQVGAATISINAEPPGTSGFGVIAIYNLEPHPGEAGLIAFNFPLLHFPVFQAINSRTESDYGLDVETRIHHPSPAARLHRRASLGRPGRSGERRRAPAGRMGLVPRRPGAPDPVQRAGKAVPQQPHDLQPGRPHRAPHRHLIRHGRHPRRHLVPGDHRLRSAELQSQPLRPAHGNGHRLPVGPRRRPPGAAAVEPESPISVGDTRRRR